MSDPKPIGMRRIAPALGLLLLAPITAEYLYGYDDSTGNVEELIGGLIVFAPLYGGAALLIREWTRRSGRGWPTMLLLGLAFGIAQAGLIDFSLFNPSYRDIPYWDEMFAGTFVPALGVNPNLALTFTVGHMIWSIAVPIAIIEALVPARSTTPWVGRLGLALYGGGFILAAGFVIWWSLDTERFLPSAAQLLGATIVIVALTAVALSRRDDAPRDREPPTVGPWLVGGTVLALLCIPVTVGLTLELAGVESGPWQRAESSWFLLGWTGFAVNLALLATLATLIWRWSSRRGWGQQHTLAAAGAALLANVATAFVAQPIGDVTMAAKYAHNTVALLGVIVLLVVGARRHRRPAPTPRPRRRHRRRLLPARRSHHRQGGDAPELARGEKSGHHWGPPNGRQRGEAMTTSGEFQ